MTRVSNILTLAAVALAALGSGYWLVAERWAFLTGHVIIP
jgi:hypothetical protein